MSELLIYTSDEGTHGVSVRLIVNLLVSSPFHEPNS